jgi:predicted RNase H-like HicB family nuclease
VAVGDRIEETETEIRSVIEFHIEGLIEDGPPVPPPQSRAEFVDVNVTKLSSMITLQARSASGVHY